MEHSAYGLKPTKQHQGHNEASLQKISLATQNKMNYQIEIRIANPSKITRQILESKQIVKDNGDLIVTQICGHDTNFMDVCKRVSQIKLRSDNTDELVTFLEIRYLWDAKQFKSANAYSIQPFRRFYREVEGEKTHIESSTALDSGYERIQRSPLVLPRLKDVCTELKYLSNGALVIAHRIKVELEQMNLHDLIFIPVLAKEDRNQSDCRIFDLSIASEIPPYEVASNWYQVVSRESVEVTSTNLDPLHLYSEDYREPFKHVFYGRSRPHTGRLVSPDGSFANLASGGLVVGLWHHYRPLIISKRLLPVFKSAKQNSVLFDPFLPPTTSN